MKFFVSAIVVLLLVAIAYWLVLYSLCFHSQFSLTEKNLSVGQNGYIFRNYVESRWESEWRMRIRAVQTDDRSWTTGCELMKVASSRVFQWVHYYFSRQTSLANPNFNEMGQQSSKYQLNPSWGFSVTLFMYVSMILENITWTKITC
mmetsp:Transcript_28668/g.92468  ORF Transcript_28668/g.92468 Transcript_28668/m.92468 type:complete len:147 (-) Transcript_28668:1772-2212(-)